MLETIEAPIYHQIHVEAIDVAAKVDLSQAYKDTLAIYYYLYGDKAIMAGGKEDLDIGKIEKFGLTYSKLKDYFSNDIGYKETSGFEDYRINYRDKAYFEK